MKSTKIMLALIATFILTWLFLSFIGYLCTPAMSFREVATSGGMIIFMFVLGWIPCIIVGMDLENRFTEQARRSRRF